ncbi:MAG: hypothetical protein P8N02_15765, partial [Actinomycetota bacterium]|nr:hypothetical protein [Actinomycetota bacterium]
SLFAEIDASPGRLFSMGHFRSMAVRPDLLSAVWNLIKLLSLSGEIPTSFVQAMVASVRGGRELRP